MSMLYVAPITSVHRETGRVHGTFTAYRIFEGEEPDEPIPSMKLVMETENLSELLDRVARVSLRTGERIECDMNELVRHRAGWLDGGAPPGEKPLLRVVPGGRP